MRKKYYTVDETWELCLKMWKWISRQCKGKGWRWCKRNVSRLKIEWLLANGFEAGEFSQNCFLCDRTTPRGEFGFDCSKCPGLKVWPEFDCADSKDYPIGMFFIRQPREFYAELKRLNKIRLERKDK